MKEKSVLMGMLLVAIGACIGYGTCTLFNSASVSLGTSIAAAWESQFNNLVDPDGQPREPDDALKISKITFNSLSMGLAHQYHQLSPSERSKLAPMISKAATLQLSPEGDTSTNSILSCIVQSGGDGHVSEECVAKAVDGK